MSGTSHDEHAGRETRLLILVVLVAVIVLLVLARFRFPAADLATMTPVANPLERLAARAPLEDVADAVSDLLAKVTPWVVVVRLDLPSATPADQPGEAPGAPPGVDAPDRPEPSPAGWVPALRVDDRLAAFVWQDRFAVGAVLDEPDHPVTVQPVEGSGFAFLDLGPGPVPATLLPFDDSPAFSFVVVVEAGRGGLSGRPLFLGRLDPVESSPISSFVLAVAGDPGLTPGDLLFTFDGQFVGLAIAHDHGIAIVPPRALSAAADRLGDLQAADEGVTGEPAAGEADRGGP